MLNNLGLTDCFKQPLILEQLRIEVFQIRHSLVESRKGDLPDTSRGMVPIQTSAFRLSTSPICDAMCVQTPVLDLSGTEQGF